MRGRPLGIGCFHDSRRSSIVFFVNSNTNLNNTLLLSSFPPCTLPLLENLLDERKQQNTAKRNVQVADSDNTVTDEAP